MADGLEYEEPIRLMPRGGSSESGSGGFAGLGGSFSGPIGRFTAKYLQERLRGMNRATVDPRVNQRRVMNSPEYAMARALGISTVYNSGGSQVDVGSAMKDLDPNRPGAAFVTNRQKEAAQARLDAFGQRNAGVPPELVQGATGLISKGDVINAGAQRNIQLPEEPSPSAPAPRQPIAPFAPSQPGPQGQPGPSAQQTGTDATAKPISRADAEKATQAPIGAKPIAPYGQPEVQSPITKETTKGPRLDTSREPQATGGAGTFEGGQQARKDVDQRLRNDLSDSAMRQRAEAGGRYVGPAPSYDQEGIDAANQRRDDAQKNWDADPRGPTGIPYDAEGKMAVAQVRNQAQDDREKIKKDYNFQAERYYGQMDKNRAAFGNPYGPDGGKTLELRERQKTPELAPLGGYDEKYTVGARGGNPDAKRGEPGYMEKEVVPVGPMTNKPAASKEEYDARMRRFAEEGEKQKARNDQKAMEAYEEKQNQEKFPIKDKGKPTERGYAGPQPRYLGGGTIRRA